MADQPQFVDFETIGDLQGHSQQVTSIIIGQSQREGEDSTLLISGSRDKSIIIWKFFNNNEPQQKTCGFAQKSLTGHNHFVSDLTLSNDSQFLISSSWDKTLRLWDLRVGKASKIFKGHEKEVLTVSFSQDNRQIISAGMDKKIYLWNTLAEKKYVSEQSNHTDWVSQVRYSPQPKASSKSSIPPYFVSVGWDGRLKVWNTNFSIRYSFKPTISNINSVSISPNVKYIAVGGKEKLLQLWDVNDLKEPLRTFEAKSPINQVSFNPKQQWVLAAHDTGVTIWDLMSQKEDPIVTLQFPIAEEKNEKKDKEDREKKKEKYTKQFYCCTAATWSNQGKTLYAGFENGVIRAWQVKAESIKI